MYPHERSLVKQLADEPFALVGVNSDRDLEEVREVVKEKNLNWRSFQNKGGDEAISDKWRIQGWPTLFVLDSEGKIRYKGHGGDFDSVIETCLAEMGRKVKIKSVEEMEAEAKEDDAEADAEETKTDEKDGE